MNHSISKTYLGYHCKRYFYTIASIHFIIWTLIPILTRSNLPFDTVESIAWGSLLQFGYDKHPFLAAWLAYFATLIGGSVEWPLYVLAQITILSAFWGIWQLGQKILTPAQALIAVLLLEGVWYYNILTPKFNPTTLMGTIWVFTGLCLYYAITTQKNIHWVLTGLFSGLSLVCKYQSILFLIPVIYVFYYYRFQIKQFYYKITITLITCLLVTLPNILWILNNDLLPFRYALEQTTQLSNKLISTNLVDHFWNPVDFLLEQIGAGIILLILFIPLLYCKREKYNFDKDFKLFVLVLGIGPIALTMLLTSITGIYLYAKWGVPYLLFIGLILIGWYRPVITLSFLKSYVWFTAIIMILTGISQAAYVQLRPYYIGVAHSDTYFPGKDIANVIESIWHQHYSYKLPYIMGSQYLVANISVYSNDKPIPFFNGSLKHNPWINLQEVKKVGAIFAWWNNEFEAHDYHSKIRKEFPNAKEIGVFTFYKTANVKADPILIRVYLLTPEISPLVKNYPLN